ncbi:MAG: intradiol ring-cleavage dioxygenase [Deltaproteobacteria bacterium]|nr:intradiol ring-cleavage dioxygenase [Deltaproteobacteria bacterium]
MHTDLSLSRRALLRLGAGVAASLAPAVAFGATPRQMKGPYYPNPDQLALRPGAFRDNDLTRVPGIDRDALGAPMLITGTVSDASGRPVPGAVVEIWQACESGRYLAARDKRRSRAHDAGFQYFGVCVADRDGRYTFRTIRPPAYPSGVLPGWVRPPHIHVKVRAPGMADFITQLYWEDPSDPLREEHARLQRRDLIIGGVPVRRRDLLIRPVTLRRPAQVSLVSHSACPFEAPRQLDFPISLTQDLYVP